MSVEGPQSESERGNNNAYQQILHLTDHKHQLVTVLWELTYRCNERCTLCYLNVLSPGAHTPEELTTDRCLGVIDQIADAGAQNLTLRGGELFLRQDWYEIASYAHTKKLHLRLLSNGVLIRPGTAERIARLHPCSVEISLYSPRAEVHERITRTLHSWERSVRALRLLRKHGVRTVLRTPMMRENVYDLEALEALAHDLGAEFRYDPIITPRDNGALDPLSHRPTYDQLVWVMRRRPELRMEVERTPRLDRPPCAIAATAMVIDPYGNIYPCMDVRRSAGNLSGRSLQEIWERSSIWRELDRMTLGEQPVCRECELNRLCVRCHGLVQREDGDLFVPSAFETPLIPGADGDAL